MRMHRLVGSAIGSSAVCTAAALVMIGTALSACAAGRVGTTVKPLAAATPAVRDALVGTWEGSVTDRNGTERTWTVDRDTNGRYRIVFVFREDGTQRRWVETGHWGAAGSFYFTLTTEAGGEGSLQPTDRSSAYYDDVYEIVSLTPSAFSYRHVTTGNTFTVRRVIRAAN